MKKNTFKTPNIKYEPIQQKKQPIWMHSIDRPLAKNETKEILLSFAVIILFFVLLVALAWLKCNYNG